MALVIKEWNAAEKPDRNGEYIHIHGREAGLVNFILALVGVDPTTTLVVDGKSVRRMKGSLSGSEHRVTPLTSVASVAYGYKKPWKGMVVMVALGIAAMAIPVVGWVVGIVLIVWGPISYFLNKQLFLEILDNGGGRDISIAFKRSVIEGKNIDERAGERIVAIIEMLLLGLGRLRPVTAAPNPPTTPSELLNRAGAEVDNLAERTRDRAEALKAQAVAAGDRVGARIGAAVGAATGTPSHGASALPSKCPGCGAAITPQDPFCGNCGAKVR